LVRRSFACPDAYLRAVDDVRPRLVWQARANPG